MTISLPTLPRQTQYNMRLVSTAADLSPAFGGPTQRISRMGSRWALDVVVPSLRWDSCGMGLVADLARGEVEPVGLALPQPGFAIGVPGDARVDGADQSGTTLNVRLLTAGYVVRKGQFFSIQTGGVRYVHVVTAEATADGTGDAALSIWPMLRVSPSGSGVVELDAPIIEGFIQQPGQEFSLRRIGSTGVAFTIVERA